MENKSERTLCRFDKELTMSDIAKQQSRLRLAKDVVVKEVLPALSNDERVRVKKGGIPVKVIDSDSGTEYDMYLAAWNDSKCYVIKGDKWAQFVTRNNLGVKDVIEISVVR